MVIGLGSNATTNTQPVHKSYTACTEIGLLPRDFGNRYLKGLKNDGSPFSIPSFVMEYEPGFHGHVDTDDKTVIIGHKDKFFLIGEQAQDMGGKATFKADKLKLAKLFLYATCPEISPLKIKTLRISLPEVRDESAREVQANLSGLHLFIKNGHEICLEVEKVEVFGECDGCYRFGIEKGLFQAPSRFNGIIDAGGGHLQAKIYNHKGKVLPDSVIRLPGTFELATKISDRISLNKDFTVDPSDILDGIEKGTFRYGYASDTDFRPYFNKCVREWVENLRAELKINWHSYMPKLAEVLIVGGSAPLLMPLQEITKNRFKIVTAPGYENLPQFCNVLGLGVK